MEKREHIVFIDTLRGIAIISVFAFHALQPSYGMDQLPWKGLFRDFGVPTGFLLMLPFTYGLGGVAIFFAISGFCIHLSRLQSSRAGYKAFFIRRFFRIYPAYLLAVLFFFFAWWHSSLGNRADSINFSAHLSFIHNLNRTTFFTINGAFWSIAVEVQLYMLYPLVAFLAERWGWKITLAFCALTELSLRCTIAFDNCSGRPFPLLLFGSPFTYWLSWTIGAYLADAYFRQDRLPFATLPVWPILVAALLFPFFRATEPFAFLLFSLATTIMLSKHLSKLPQERGRIGAFSRRLAFIGSFSYSLYLIHHPLLQLVPMAFSKYFPNFHAGPMASFLTIFIVLWPALAAVSWAMYIFVERTGIRWGKLLEKQAG